MTSFIFVDFIWFNFIWIDLIWVDLLLLLLLLFVLQHSILSHKKLQQNFSKILIKVHRSCQNPRHSTGYSRNNFFAIKESHRIPEKNNDIWKSGKQCTRVRLVNPTADCLPLIAKITIQLLIKSLWCWIGISCKGVPGGLNVPDVVKINWFLDALVGVEYRDVETESQARNLIGGSYWCSSHYFWLKWNFQCQLEWGYTFVGFCRDP